MAAAEQERISGLAARADGRGPGGGRGLRRDEGPRRLRRRPPPCAQSGGAASAARLTCSLDPGRQSIHPRRATRGTEGRLRAGDPDVDWHTELLLALHHRILAGSCALSSLVMCRAGYWAPECTILGEWWGRGPRTTDRPVGCRATPDCSPRPELDRTGRSDPHQPRRDDCEGCGRRDPPSRRPATIPASTPSSTSSLTPPTWRAERRRLRAALRPRTARRRAHDRA